MKIKPSKHHDCFFFFVSGSLWKGAIPFMGPPIQVSPLEKVSKTCLRVALSDHSRTNEVVKVNHPQRETGNAQ